MTISFPVSQGTIASVSAMVTVSEGTVDAVSIIAVAAAVTVALVVAALWSFLLWRQDFLQRTEFVSQPIGLDAANRKKKN